MNTQSPCDMTHPRNLTTAHFLHIMGELSAHPGHTWVHYKHAAAGRVRCGFKISHPPLNCYDLAFQERKTVWPTPEGWVGLVHVLSLTSNSFGCTGSNRLAPESQSIAQCLVLKSFEEIFDGNNGNNWGELLIATAIFHVQVYHYLQSAIGYLISLGNHPCNVR